MRKNEDEGEDGAGHSRWLRHAIKSSNSSDGRTRIGIDANASRWHEICNDVIKNFDIKANS
jgi:hypothetical protein